MNTSVAAYASITGVKTNMNSRVLAFIERQADAGATREECVDGTGIKLQTMCGRLRDLEKQGHIVKSGRVRPQKSGRDACVYVISILGPEGDHDDDE